jgi:hypothetical protein
MAQVQKLRVETDELFVERANSLTATPGIGLWITQWNNEISEVFDRGQMQMVNRDPENKGCPTKSLTCRQALEIGPERVACLARVCGKFNTIKRLLVEYCVYRREA